MVTSVIGPGFIAHTAAFTAQPDAAFASVSLFGLLINIALQTSIWRVMSASGLRAPETWL